MKVSIWTKSVCVQCEQTKKLMDKYGIEYVEESLEDNPLMVEGFRQQGLLSAPIVVTDTGLRWSGFRMDKIKALAHHLFGENK